MHDRSVGGRDYGFAALPEMDLETGGSPAQGARLRKEE